MNMEKQEDYFSQNEKELMEYFGFTGTFGLLKLRMKFFKTWMLHKSAYSSVLSSWIVKMQRLRGVKIGENCHFAPYVLIDLLYPKMINIGNNVTISSNVMIFAHVNPTTNPSLKEHGYPRTVNSVNIDDGVIISPGSIITAGTKIGKNCIIGAGSVVSTNIPENSLVLGNPARVIKKLDL